MPRELTFYAVIPGCSIQDFYAIACSDTRAITQFHRDVNKDESACCSTWADDAPTQSRLVEFSLAMAVPATVQRFVGAGPIRIKETQQLTWLEGRTAIKIVSVPELQIAVGQSLKTAAELVIQETSTGVRIDVAVQVNASVPWPMQGTVEALMCDQARKTVGQYVDYIGGYVAAALEEMNNQRKQQQQQQQQQPAPAAAAAVSPAALQPAGPTEQHVEGPRTPAESAVTAAPPALAAAAPIPLPPPQPAAAAAVTALVPAGAPAAPAPLPQQQLVPAGAVVTGVPAAAAAAAAEPADVFFDASEVVAGSGLDLLLRELREERAARLEANRLLASISASVCRLDAAVTRELAFQEGVRYAEQRMAASQSNSSSSSATNSSYSSPTSLLLLSVAVAAAAASAATALVLTRRAAAR